MKIAVVELFNSNAFAIRKGNKKKRKRAGRAL
jgi:hypothetical protein